MRGAFRKNADGIHPFDLRSFLWYEPSARDDSVVKK